MAALAPPYAAKRLRGPQSATDAAEAAAVPAVAAVFIDTVVTMRESTAALETGMKAHAKGLGLCQVCEADPEAPHLHDYGHRDVEHLRSN